jgi:hypothetical protein
MKPHRACTIAALVVLGLAAGCGRVVATAGADAVVAQSPADGTPPARHYTGPLDGKNAAAKALECTGKVSVRQAGLNPDEEVDGASTPEGAIAKWNKDAMPYNHPIARDGYELAARKGDRALLTYTYEGRVRSAGIAVDDTDPKTYLKGWGILDAAWCDLSEFPPELDKNHWAQVWSDRAGNRVSTRILHSSAGAAHCNWESATFLFMDNAKRWYLRDPEGVITGLAPYGKKSPAYVHGPYRPDSKLPKAAHDTGYRRDGMALYLTDDAAYVRYPDHVEAWPRTTEGWGCA